MKARFTGTGLDSLIRIIETDAGVKSTISASKVDAGAQAAGELNHLIVDGIRELGLANDGTIDTADLRGLGDWIQESTARNQTYREFYGANRNGVETGFQLVKGEHGSTKLLGENAIDEVADGIYSVGFGYDDDDRLLDVKGNSYRSITMTANWLDDLLSDADMKTLSNPNGSLVVEGTTGTGLDVIADVFQSAPGLIANVSRTDIATAVRAADALNYMYLDGIKALGLGKDGEIDKRDVVDLDKWIHNNPGRFATFKDLEKDVRKVIDKGATLATLDEVFDGVHPHIGHIVNHGIKGVYQIGNGTDSKGNILYNYKGELDVGTRVAGEWFDQLLSAADKAGWNKPAAGQDNPDTGQGGSSGSGVIEGTPGTGLDQLVDIIRTDPGLSARAAQGDIISPEDIAEVARAAEAMNKMIVEAIKSRGLDDDGKISADEIKDISDYIQSDKAMADEFVLLHGRDGGNGVESGLHLAVGDGGTASLFGRHAVNIVAESVYSVGFDVVGDRVLDEDGDLGFSIFRTADYIDDLYF